MPFFAFGCTVLPCKVLNLMVTVNTSVSSAY